MKINVSISQCLSCDATIEVPENYDSENLLDYVREQIVLPSEVALEHCSEAWYVDDFCVNE